MRNRDIRTVTGGLVWVVVMLVVAGRGGRGGGSGVGSSQRFLTLGIVRAALTRAVSTTIARHVLVRIPVTAILAAWPTGCLRLYRLVRWEFTVHWRAPTVCVASAGLGVL